MDIYFIPGSVRCKLCSQRAKVNIIKCKIVCPNCGDQEFKDYGEYFGKIENLKDEE